MTKKQEKAIREHGIRLQAIFAGVMGWDSIKLCKRLRRLEQGAHQVSEAFCNGDVSTETAEAFFTGQLLRVDSLLGFTASQVPVFINRDPRGYALKLAWGR